ncbi:MAG: hypothetical protein KDA29_12070 [Phycisphaerales bacterium]|nr:hypothetical protein [Phycisphaerales bacterium]
MMIRSTALLTVPVACALVNAAPQAYSNFDLNYDIGIYLPEFPFVTQAAPLDVSLSASSQAPLDFIGVIPENTIALQERSAQVSFDIGWTGIGGDTSSPSNIKLIDGDAFTVHWLADPDTTSDFTAPRLFESGESVGSGQPSSILLYLAANPTLENGFDNLWFVPLRFIVGVTLELNDGTHYGFVEFEDISPLTMERDYQPVRWGYETEPNTAFVIPEDCGLADMNRDNALNFFDVSLYLAAYTNNRFAADLNLDGIVNFFDVSTFLFSYNSGCP